MARIDIHQILCPVDLSPHSKHALDYAFMLARWYRAQVTALEVVWNPLPPVPLGPGAPVLRPAEFGEIKEALKRFAEAPAGTGVSVKSILQEGPVLPRILEEARALWADLIVMGTHGATGFEHLLLGSMTEKVLRKAPCPVLTVPPAAGPAPGAPAPPKPPPGAVAFSPWWMAGLRLASSMAEESGGRLIAAYVLDLPADRLPWTQYTLEPEAFRRQREADARRELTTAISPELRTWCDITEVVAVGKPHEKILCLAREYQADAIVIGVHGRGAVDLAFFGSTANQVVRAASCPVLTVRS